ncbi:tyrosine-type recombinase/integrase [Paenibacillus sp. Leaf72]|uniref:tyrosine-type recombinase/integrase n=1 Tax=Paenibacillus sp. Leaf72 TaxID=1736234 RepID=UPI002E0ECE68
MFHTGLRTMEVCDLAPGDIQIGKRSGQLTVRSGKRNKQREVSLNATCRTALEKYLQNSLRTVIICFHRRKPVID